MQPAGRPRLGASSCLKPALVGAVLLLVGCGGSGGGSAPTVGTPQAAAPVISSGTATEMGSAASYSVDVKGTGFAPGAAVFSGGLAQATNYVSATELTATVASSAGATALTVTASNSATGAPSSNALTISVPAAQSAPVPTVAAAQALGPVVQNPSVIARDGAWSAVVGGVSMWTFSDTLLSKTNADGVNFISDSRAWTPLSSAASGINLSSDYVDATGAITQSFPFTPDEAAFNAAHGHASGCTLATDPLCGESYAIWSAPIVVPPASANTQAYFFYKLLIRGGAITTSTSSGRVVLGVGIASLQNGVMTRPVVSPGSAHPTLMWQQSAQQAAAFQSVTGAYDSGALLLGNTLLMLSCDTIVVASHQCSEASVDISNVLNISKWTYYNSSLGFQPDPTQASLQFSEGSNEPTMIYVAALGEYMTMYSPTNSNSTVFRVALQPWGPWSAEQPLFNGQQPTGADAATNFDYDTLAHPEFQEQNGSVQYVTYIQPDGADGEPRSKKIQLVRVTFSR